MNEASSMGLNSIIYLYVHFRVAIMFPLQCFVVLFRVTVIVVSDSAFAVRVVSDAFRAVGAD